MSDHEHLPRGRASLEVLRAEAADELDTIVHERLLAGEDPWDFMEELPTVDELVVYLLRADNIVENGGRRPSSARDYRVLRQIALDHPGLTGTVWRVIGDVDRRRPRHDTRQEPGREHRQEQTRGGATAQDAASGVNNRKAP